MKETWNILNQLINKHSKTTQISSIVIDDTCLTRHNEIADSMNDHVCSIGEKLSSNIHSTENPLLKSNYLIGENHECFHFQRIHPEKLSKLANRFKISLSCGIDGISSFFLKIGVPVLALSLCCIFNTSISQGGFPECWKIARVSPIHKDSSTEERSIYRPISVLPVVSRLFENIIYDQVFTYFAKNEFFYSDQSGFRQFHSVLTCLIESTNNWYLNVDKGYFSGVLFIDLKEAFDTVDHEILIAKLRLYEIEGVELDWFTAYLNERKQLCKVNGKISKIQDN